MYILGIESSCDETAVGIIDLTNCQLVAHQINSQVELHNLYGGVVPELASRDHVHYISGLTKQAINEAKINYQQLSAICYTQGPGLAGTLLVGASFAEALACSLNIPALPIHHLEGHLLSPLLSANPPNFPFVALLVSGGHTQLIAVKKFGDYLLLGDTRDDAAGEAFDKTAKLLGLPYPGGAALAKLAEQANHSILPNFPRPLINSKELDFSFSGLKTAVLNYLQQNNLSFINKDLSQSEQIIRANIAAAFQQAVVDVLVKKSILAVEKTGFDKLVIAGGVSANKYLRQQLQENLPKKIKLYYPEIEFCTDNGAMIALVGALKFKQLFASENKSVLFNNQQLNKEFKSYSYGVKPRWDLFASN